MKKIILLPLLVSAFLLIAPSDPPKDLLQVVEESKRFLVNGVPYSFNATKFREQYQADTCVLPMICNSDNLLFVKNISKITNEPGLHRGHALIKRDRPENQWLCVLFIPIEDIEEFGSVQKLSFQGDTAKVFMTAHFLNVTKLYRRWDK